MTAIAQTAYITTRHLRYFWRQPWFVLMALIQPVIWLLLFGALFKSVTEIPGSAPRPATSTTSSRGCSS